MATWIAHLRIVENLLGHYPELDPAGFAVGNIAPDSGIPDEKWEKFTPPPEVTHFGNFSGAFRKLADMEFYRRYLLPLRSTVDFAPVSFRIGYFFHLIVDNLWSENIGAPTTQRFSAEFAADKNFIWEVKKDWYGLDFIYIRDHPDCLFWRVFLDARPGTRNWISCRSRRFDCEWSTSNKTISGLTKMYKKRIIVPTASFLVWKWIVSSTNQRGNFLVYINTYGLTMRPRTVSSPPWI